MGDEVDRPFCRDWVIQSMRLVSGLTHRGKRPAVFMGQLEWSRPERVGMYLLEGGAQIAVFDCNDGTRALAVISEDNSEMMKNVTNVIAAKFHGMRIINDASPRRAYDDKLIEAFIKAGPSVNVKLSIDMHAWHRAIVKMALGLAAKTFGDEFVCSASAQRLRVFLHEADPVRRNALGLHGRGGPLFAEPTITHILHPGGNEHLFILASSGAKLSFVANLFGHYENVVLVDEGAAFGDQLPKVPGDAVAGVAWSVDPAKKSTNGPFPLSSLIATTIR